MPYFQENGTIFVLALKAVRINFIKETLHHLNVYLLNLPLHISQIHTAHFRLFGLNILLWGSLQN